MTEKTESFVGLISLLNRAVARELQVSIQYMLQHTLLTGGKESKENVESLQIKRDTFIERHSPTWFPGTSLKKIAVTEMRHAEAVAERIVALGEIPTSDPEPVVIGDSSREMIEINQKAEEGAIQLYTQIIEAAKKQGDEITAKLFEQILSDEKNHLRMFKNVLE
jgi:bacterioferritin